MEGVHLEARAESTHEPLFLGRNGRAPKGPPVGRCLRRCPAPETIGFVINQSNAIFAVQSLQFGRQFDFQLFGLIAACSLLTKVVRGATRPLGAMPRFW